MLGRHFTLETDHKPLEILFGENKQIPKIASARITNWAISIMRYDYEIKYKPGSEIPHADALTRMKFLQEHEQENIDVVINSVAFEKNVVDMAEVKKNTRRIVFYDESETVSLKTTGPDARKRNFHSNETLPFSQ